MFCFCGWHGSLPLLPGCCFEYLHLRWRALASGCCSPCELRLAFANAAQVFAALEALAPFLKWAFPLCLSVCCHASAPRPTQAFFRWHLIRAVPCAPVVESTLEMYCALFCLCPATRLLVSACVAQTGVPSRNPEGAVRSSFCFQQSFALCGCDRFQSSRWQQPLMLRSCANPGS